MLHYKKVPTMFRYFGLGYRFSEETGKMASLNNTHKSRGPKSNDSQRLIGEEHEVAKTPIPSIGKVESALWSAKH